ncbi:MAG: hypothetical protein MK207_01260 [Saprospiraceae bacterium]|nr:hypothetical protein [Saprospiraceae bacterium]
MNKITPELIQKFEFYSIFLNNILLLLGVSLFGWTLFETLFLYWLEPLAALLVINYLILIVPLKNGRPGLLHLAEYRIPSLKTIGLNIYTIIMHYIALVFIINLCKVDGWNTSEGFFYTLAQMPAQLWNGSLLLLTIVFLLAYLMPPILLERRGIKPSLETMPMQTKIMIHPSQFIINYLWFGILWVVHNFNLSSNPIVLIAILMVLKSVYEAFLFFRIQKEGIL